MNLFKRILCPLDFSDASRAALKYAKSFADTFDSELVLMHVSPNVAEAYTALMPDFPNYGAIHEQDLVEQLNEFTGDWAGRFKKVIRVGTPYLEILEYAHEENFDLIILGAKGLSKFERLFLGVTGEKVTRKAQCPVLTVHAKPAGLPIKRILLPVDFSPLSYAVLPIVAAIADQYEAEINLLHVVELGHQLDPKIQSREYDFFEKLKERLEEQWDLPQAFKTIETKKFIRHHIGSAGYGIMEFAQDWDTDLIAMATHGRTGLSKVLMGSVTEKVIKISPCPVLSVRSQTNP